MGRWFLAVAALLGMMVVSQVGMAKKSRRASKGFLVIACSQEGASVVLDGVFIGRTPLKRKSLRFGSHRLKVTKDGFVPFVRELKVRSRVPITVNVNLQRADSPGGVPGRVPDLGLDLRPFRGSEAGVGDDSSVDELALEPLAPIPSQKTKDSDPLEDDGLALEPLPEIAPLPGTGPKEEERTGGVPSLELTDSVSPASAWYEDWKLWGGAGLLVTAGVVTAIVLSLPEPKSGPGPSDLDHQLCGSARPCSSW